MCGRTAQTQGAVMAASTSLKTNPSFGGGFVDRIGPRSPSNKSGSAGTKSSGPSDHELEEHNDAGTFPWHDNFNLSPGHDAVVFTMDNKTGEIQMDRKVWGLVTRNGTSKSPLPPGSSKHFANLMFNARSDTLFSKPTFSKLLQEGKTCLVAFDGFFEWKEDLLAGKNKKQPYFVFRNNDNKNNIDNDAPQDQPYLLMAGLWTSVATGYAPPQPTTLDTFTILTTEVCGPLKWLHSRMPVCIWNEELALKWLRQPTLKLHQQLDLEAHQTEETLLQWHAVSPQMSSIKYREADAIKAMPKPKSVKAFFAPVNSKGSQQSPAKSDKKMMNEASADINTKLKENTSTATTSAKRSANKSYTASTEAKKAKTASPPAKKKGAITSFFSPKSKA